MPLEGVLLDHIRESTCRPNISGAFETCLFYLHIYFDVPNDSRGSVGSASAAAAYLGILKKRSRLGGATEYFFSFCGYL